jgi:hypothetical protein
MPGGRVGCREAKNSRALTLGPSNMNLVLTGIGVSMANHVSAEADTVTPPIPLSSRPAMKALANGCIQMRGHRVGQS